MTVRVEERSGQKIAIIGGDELLLTDGPSALDLLATLDYQYDCRCVVLEKRAVAEDFFRLSSGVAGEVAQKFVNYSFRLAIVGDFSGYTSQPLRDFIYESNRGRHLYFVANEQEAVAKLARE